MLSRNMDFDPIPNHVLKLSLKDIPSDHKSRLYIFDLVLMNITTNNKSEIINSIVNEINKAIIADGKNSPTGPIDLDYANPEAARLHTRTNYLFNTQNAVKCLIDKTEKLPILMSNKEVNQLKKIFHFFQSELIRKST